MNWFDSWAIRKGEVICEESLAIRPMQQNHLEGSSFQQKCVFFLEYEY